MYIRLLHLHCHKVFHKIAFDSLILPFLSFNKYVTNTLQVILYLFWYINTLFVFNIFSTDLVFCVKCSSVVLDCIDS